MNNSIYLNCEQQEISNHYEEYTREYQKAIINLEKFNSKTKDLIIDTYRNYNEINNDVTLNKLRTYIQIIQKINYEILADQSQDLNITSNNFLSPDINSDKPESISTKEKPPEILVNETVELSPKLKQNSLIDHEHPVKHFNYPQPEIHLYSKDHKGVCVISYVRKCEYKKSFFVVDNSMSKSQYTSALSKLAHLSFELKPHSNWIPGVNDVFGVFIDNCLFRAVKQTKAEPNDRDFKIFLIDIGEIFDIELGKDEIYDLPKDVRVMPAQGLYCILDKKSTITIENIKDGLYKERTFRITKIKKSTFHMDDIKEITNPFYTEIVTKKNNEPNDPTRIIKSATECTSSSDEFTLSGSETSNRVHTATEQNQSLTQPLFIENKSTSSAIEAVMTFRPTDDKRICHFYNPRTRSCFKGANCKLEHLPQVEGGWSRDKVVTKTAILAELEYPSVDSLITIIPTSIDIGGSFWGQIEFGLKKDSFTKLKHLNLQLNSPEFVLNYKELDHFPVYSELVIAQYVDQLWYRGKIIGDYDYRFKVFFVDYGNAEFITLNKIRKWDNRCDCLPFQAVRCNFANISFIQENHKKKLDAITKLILNKRMTAKVINNLSDLDVLIMDSNGNDVGEQLVKEKIATHRKMMVPMYQSNSNPVPQ